MDEYGYMLSKYYDFMTFSKVFICYGFPSILTWLYGMSFPKRKTQYQARPGSGSTYATSATASSRTNLQISVLLFLSIFSAPKSCQVKQP